MRRAVIDIGSNSVRLLLAEMDGGSIHSSTKRLKATRIAEGLMESGRLGEPAMQRSRQAVVELARRAAEWGAEPPIYCYATSAVREAANGDEFISTLAGIDGLLPEVISGELEAMIAYMGASTGLPVLDAGGASTELVAMKNGKLKSHSVRMGCVAMQDMFIHTDPVSTQDRQALDAYCTGKAAELLAGAGVAQAADIVGVGGTATQLAMLKLGLLEYDAAAVSGCYLSAHFIAGLYERLASLAVEERKALPGMAETRADIILPGVAIINAALISLDADGMYASDGDGLEGYLLYMSGIKGDVCG